MKTSKILVAVVVLQSLLLLGRWSGNGPVQAQVPDAGGQRVQMIEELKSLNSKMDKLVEELESGKVQVKVVQADDKNK